LIEHKNLLVKFEQYLAAGVHIGTKEKKKDMAEFIYNIRTDGLAVLNVQKIDQRIRISARFLSRLDPKDILLVSSRETARIPVTKFSEVIGNHLRIGRFMPGSLTNPNYKEYIEPKVVFVVDPTLDKQATIEAFTQGIPIMAICDSNNFRSYVDFIIPGNNKGKKALALTFWILAREILKEKGEISQDHEFQVPLEEFGG
jgi:small subunit ribosomal protein S2